jgi:hypothetical protein
MMLIDELIKGGKDYSLQLYPGAGTDPRGDWTIWSLQKAKWEFCKGNCKRNDDKGRCGVLFFSEIKKQGVYEKILTLYINKGFKNTGEYI